MDYRQEEQDIDEMEVRSKILLERAVSIIMNCAKFGSSTRIGR
ncbi:hypothetical protein LJR153_000943 [Paenibacillus sp. LjRoot153]